MIRVRDDSSLRVPHLARGRSEDATDASVCSVFPADGKSLYLISALGRDTAAARQKDLAGGGETELAASPRPTPRTC